jgi:hypothetical protein
MPRKPSPFPGTSDYMGASVQSLIAQLVLWRDMLVDSAGRLRLTDDRVKDEVAAFDDPEGIESYVVHFADLFNDYAGDLDRVLAEIPRGVRARHVANLRELYEHCRDAERECVPFKNLHVSRRLRDESKRPLIDRIYETSRQALVDLYDLSNLVARLETFVEEPGERATRPGLLNVKVTILGVEFNLKELYRRVRAEARSRLNRKWLPPDGKSD